MERKRKRSTWFSRLVNVIAFAVLIFAVTFWHFEKVIK